MTKEDKNGEEVKSTETRDGAKARPHALYEIRPNEYGFSIFLGQLIAFIGVLGVVFGVLYFFVAVSDTGVTPLSVQGSLSLAFGGLWCVLLGQ